MTRGRGFLDYHQFVDVQADQIYATADLVAERARKIAGGTLCSIGHTRRLQRVLDDDAEYVTKLEAHA